MKKLICELCGSQHMVKDGEFFVCESCGTKYTAEEAQKLFVEVSVKEDNADKIASYYEVARRALGNGDHETAYTHYNMLMGMVPGDWEAFFFSTYCKSMSCVIANIVDACQSVTNTLEDTFTLIKKIDNKSEQEDAVRRVCAACGIIAETMAKSAYDFDFKHMSNDAVIRRSQVVERDNRIRSAVHIVTMCGIHSINKFTDTQIRKKHIVPTLKAILEFRQTYAAVDFMYNHDMIKSVLNSIEQYDPEYVAKFIEKELNGGKFLKKFSIGTIIVSLLCLIGGILALTNSMDWGLYLALFGGCCIFIGVWGINYAKNIVKKWTE